MELLEHTLTLMEETNLLLEETDSDIEVLKNLKPNEYIKVKEIPATQTTPSFQNYINRLKKEGLDIGRGDSKQGFKMPIPKNEAPRRKLIIFRRH